MSEQVAKQHRANQFSRLENILQSRFCPKHITVK